MIAKLALDDATELEFELEVSGTNTQNVDVVRAVIQNENLGYKIVIDGVVEQRAEKMDVLINVPKLLDVIQAGEYQFCLEVVVDNRFFKPLEDVIEFTSPAKTEAMHTKTEAVKKTVTAKAKTKVEVDLDAIPEGCEIAMIEGLAVVKNKHGLYIGVKLRENIKWANKAHTTLTNLVNDVA